MAVRHDADPKALIAARKRVAAKSGPKLGLTPRIKRAVEILVFGDDAGKIYTDYAEIALAAGLRSARSLREALNKPAVAAYYAQQIAAKKNRLKALGLNTIEGVMTDPELKKTAAGAKVRVDAAKVVLVEPAGSQVNVQVNNSLSVTPGYVIKLNRGRTDLSDVDDVVTIDTVNAEGENSHG